MTTKNEIIESQIRLLGEQRDLLIKDLIDIDFSNMQAFQKKAEVDLQVNKIDTRIDVLLDKL